MTASTGKARSLGVRITAVFALVFVSVVLLTDALVHVNFRTAELTRGLNRLVDDAKFMALLAASGAEGDLGGVSGRFGAVVVWSGSARSTVIPGSEPGGEWAQIATLLPPPRSLGEGPVRAPAGESVRLQADGGPPRTVWVATVPVGGSGSMLQVASGLPESREAIRAFGVQLFGLSALIAVVGFWVMLMVGAGISRPILVLTRAAGRIAAGDFSARVRMRRNDELGSLLATFDTMAERMEESERGRNRFMVDVTHELKTPLASIKALVEAIIAGRDSGDEIRSLLGAVDLEIDRMSDLVRALITYTRLEELVPRREPIGVDQAAARIGRLYSARAEQQGSRIAVPGSAIRIEADPGMLDELLLNLLDNALRHGGPQADVTIGASDESGAVRVWVENTGQPIPVAVVDTMFEPFTSGEPSRSRALAGSGLGLAIVKRIVDAHGWTIEVDSSDSRTRFTVVIPPTASRPEETETSAG